MTHPLSTFEPDFVRVPVSTLKVGDIVWEHGMRLLLIKGGLSPNYPSAMPVYSFTGKVLNPDKVREDQIVPWGWLIDNPDGEPRWTVQSNDRVHWLKEA